MANKRYEFELMNVAHIVKNGKLKIEFQHINVAHIVGNLVMIRNNE